MGKKIAVVGVGAVGGYTAAHMIRAGEDVTLIDMWPAHVEEMRANGLRITHHEGDEPFTVKVRALHIHEAQSLAKEHRWTSPSSAPSLMTRFWATTLISQYLAHGGFIVSLQNSINEETHFPGVVGWGPTSSALIASSHQASTTFKASSMVPGTVPARRGPGLHGVPCGRAAGGELPRARKRAGADGLGRASIAPRSRPICGASAGASW